MRLIEEIGKLIVAAVLFVWVLVGCATPPERFMTAEQDALFAKNCAEGCAVVPESIWRQIVEVLAQHGIRL